MSRNKIDSFKLKTKRFIYHVKNDLVSTENIILAVAVLICLVLTINSISSMSRNWQLSERLASEKQTLKLLEVEIETLELENSYYASAEYQELAARKLANKKLPGENLVYLPENSDAAKNKHKQATVKVITREPSNFEKWMNFLFPKNS